MKQSTNSPHMKGKHLSFEERVMQTRLRDGWSFRKIAREIGCAEMNMHEEKFCFITAKLRDTELKRGENCGRKLLTLARETFLLYVTENFRKNNWSLDACIGRALKLGFFKREEIVCTKTF